jgi:hypothetical protein
VSDTADADDMSYKQKADSVTRLIYDFGNLQTEFERIFERISAIADEIAGNHEFDEEVEPVREAGNRFVEKVLDLKARLNDFE